MDKRQLFNQVINIVNDNYLFLGDQEHKWLTYIRDVEKNIDSIDNIYECLNNILLTLKDPHTRLFSNKKVDTFFDINFIWIEDRMIIIPNILGYTNEILGGEIIEVNNQPIRRIINKFKRKFEKFPKCIIQDEIAKYLKTSSERTLQTVTILKNGNKYLEEIKTISSERIRKIINDEIKQIYDKNIPIILKDIDEDTLLIKISTFRVKNIDKYILDKSSLIKSKKRIIFDVRDNRGGFVEETKKVASMIIEDDVELDYKIISKSGIEDNYNKVISNHNNIFSSKDIFILCNEYSMSSTEFIFIRCLVMGYNNVKVIGTSTAGMSGQAKVFSFSSGDILQVTVKKYLDKFDQEITTGYIPDKIVDISINDYIKGIDRCLEMVMSY